MRQHLKACLFGGTIFAAGLTGQARADTYTLLGPDATATPFSVYAWPGGSFVDEFAYALSYIFNFSNYGVVRDSVLNKSFSYLTGFESGYADGIISPYWPDSYVSGYGLFVAGSFFLNGGDLILFNDSPYVDAIGAYLGVPTIGVGGDEIITGLGFPFNGEFGNVPGIQMSGNVGFLDAADVAATGGTVLAINANGDPVVAFWNDNEYAPGAGKMLIVTDVDSITDGDSFLGSAQFFPPNNNGKFGLNLIAGLILHVGCSGADINLDNVINLDDLNQFVESFLNDCL